MSSLISVQLPGTIVVGAGASGAVAEHARRLGARHVLLVTDEFIAGQGLADAVAAQLSAAAVAVTIFSDVQPDPTDTNVLAGLDALRASGADAVVALGGGSVLDTAKMIAVLDRNELPISQYMGYHKLAAGGVPLIAVPTTAGTGSEATRVAVITDSAQDTKMMILDNHLLPAVALVDYELSMSMPKGLTAHVGVDTLTHGIEAYVSALANPMSDPYALSTIRLVAEHLETAWGSPTDSEARAAMAVAACQGGVAFSNSSVALVHGMSRPLGAIFHIAHGLSNSVLLPAVTRYSLAAATHRYATIARTMGFASVADSDAASAQALADGLEELNQRLEVPRLRELPGVSEERFEASLEKMAADALASGSPARNPRVPSAEEIVALYREAF
jgi:alcohol dehydrogenase class IV